MERIECRECTGVFASRPAFDWHNCGVYKRTATLEAENSRLKAENENLKAYAKYERDLGAEPFAIENLDLQQQVSRLTQERDEARKEGFLIGVEWCASQIEKFAAVDRADEDRREGVYGLQIAGLEPEFTFNSKYDAFEAFEKFEHFLDDQAKHWRESAPKWVDKVLKTARTQSTPVAEEGMCRSFLCDRTAKNGSSNCDVCAARTQKQSEEGR